MRALVADTSAVMRKVLGGALQRTGITHVDQTDDGSELVLMVAATTYDLVVMDTQLKNLHGLDALRAIRAAGSKAPVIVVSAEGERNQVLEVLKAGAAAYVIKPVEPQVLVNKIYEVIAKTGRSEA